MGNWVILLLKVAVIATENSRYANIMSCDQKFKSSNSIKWINHIAATMPASRGGGDSGMILCTSLSNFLFSNTP